MKLNHLNWKNSAAIVFLIGFAYLLYGLFPEKNCANEFLCSLAGDYRTYMQGLTPNSAPTDGMAIVQKHKKGMTDADLLHDLLLHRSNPGFKIKEIGESVTISTYLRVHKVAFVAIASEWISVEFRTSNDATITAASFYIIGL
jgi:hypothetical protein